MKKVAKDLNHDDVIAALNELKSGRKTHWGDSRKFILLYDGVSYAPKAVLGLAIALAKQIEERDVPKFSGGAQTNKLLRDLGFQIVEKHPAGSIPTLSQITAH